MNKKMKISDYVAFFAGLLTLFLFILKFTFEPGMKWITVVSPLWIIYGISIVQAIMADYVLRKQQQRKKDQEDFLKRFEPKEKPSLWQKRLAEMKYGSGYVPLNLNTLERLKRANPERCRAFGHTVEEMGAAFWGLALSGEVGELNNLVKKKLRGDKITDFELKFGKEAADILTYLDLYCTFFKVDLERNTIDKFNEVSEKVN
jgi:NTP pyrophosphatase (non-canonical NTP hydrolase)